MYLYFTVNRVSLKILPNTFQKYLHLLTFHLSYMIFSIVSYSYEDVIALAHLILTIIINVVVLVYPSILYFSNG